jgi:DNA adenine methylase
MTFVAFSNLPSQPRPFLRWAGGKRQIVNLLVDTIPNSFFSSNSRYFEPFLGGGALVFALGDSGSSKYIPGERIFINDSNPELICTYFAVRDDIELLVKKLKSLSRNTSKKAFLEVRASRPRNEIGRAARFIYLNKTCFNGLWRVNNDGQFNVPWAGLKSPKVFDEYNLRVASERLQGSQIFVGNYQTPLSLVQRGDLVYLDPPYLPLSSTSNFSKYAKEGFGILDHYALSGVIDGLTAQGVRVILSNSDTPLTRKIFGNSLSLHQVSVQRMIPAKSESRQRVNEVIGTNFSISTNALLRQFKVI